MQANVCCHKYFICGSSLRPNNINCDRFKCNGFEFIAQFSLIAISAFSTCGSSSTASILAPGVKTRPRVFSVFLLISCSSLCSGVRFSKLPRTFWARKHFGALFGCFSRVPKSVSQNTRKCPELSPDIFRESFRVTGYDNGTRAGGKIILEHGFIITTFNFSS